MSLSYNRTLIAGHLTRDPEVKILHGDRSVATFGIAQSSRWKAADGTQREETIFIDVEAWGRVADFVGRFAHKGLAVFIEGKLKQDTWIDKATGAKRSRLFLAADDVRFVESKRGDGDQAAAPAAPAAAPTAPRPTPTPVPPAGDDEPPF